MINKGKDGSLSFFFENKIIASVPLNEDYTYEDWVKIGNDIIIDGLRDKDMKFNGIKTAFWTCIHKMKQYDNKLSLRDNLFVAQAFMALIKLKQIDPDDDEEGILIMPARSLAARK